MQKNPEYTQTENMTVSNKEKGKYIEGIVFTGNGPELVKMISEQTGLDGSAILDSIINHLLVNKGVDWTGTILNEYLGMYNDSLATFSLIWDKISKQFISHGAVFQSYKNPDVGLVAHIRTSDDFKYLGLGTLVTEQVTTAGFNKGAKIIVLATDDKLNRLEAGEKAAHSLYSRMGYGIMAEKRLADTVDWLMIINEEIYNGCQEVKKSNNNGYAKQIPDDIKRKQENLIKKTRNEFSAKKSYFVIEKVSDGDLAGLFLLTTLCPPNDFRIKLYAWDVHQGPEFERSFVVNIRPAMMDQDRLEDGTMIVRDENGFIVAVCAAKQAFPFSRNTMRIDFYCLPEFLENNKVLILQLINDTIRQLKMSEKVSKPCNLSFSGIDEIKISIFEELGFEKSGNKYNYYTQCGDLAYVATEYSREL